VGFHAVTLMFSDNETRSIPCSPGESVVQAANRHGLNLLVDCREGGCGTCKAICQFGRFSLDDYSRDALPDAEQAQGRILACRMQPESPCVVEFDYPLSSVRRGAAPVARSTTIADITPRADDVMELTLASQDGKAFNFLPGQYANLEVPDTRIVRSYSFMTEPDGNQAAFLIRLRRGGAMSDWLQGNPPVGTRVLTTGPFGRFFLRDQKRPLIFVAGGTGVGPMIAMLEALKTAGATPPSVKLVFGVNSSPGLFYRDRLERLIASFVNSELRISIVSPDPGWDGVTGTVADVLDKIEIDPAAHAYLCGPPIMVARAQALLEHQGFDKRAIFAETFLPKSMLGAL
jgi:benzoate/toluate 1,2-dioxygenase reductase component